MCSSDLVVASGRDRVSSSTPRTGLGRGVCVQKQTPLPGSGPHSNPLIRTLKCFSVTDLGSVCMSCNKDKQTKIYE